MEWKTSGFFCNVDFGKNIISAWEKHTVRLERSFSSAISSKTTKLHSMFSADSLVLLSRLGSKKKTIIEWLTKYQQMILLITKNIFVLSLIISALEFLSFSWSKEEFLLTSSRWMIFFFSVRCLSFFTRRHSTLNVICVCFYSLLLLDFQLV